MWYLLHKKNEELNVDNIEKIIRFKEMKNPITTFEGYCLTHKIPETYEKPKDSDEFKIHTTLNIINNETVKLCIWEWDVVFTFKSLTFEHENSEYEIYHLEIK